MAKEDRSTVIEFHRKAFDVFLSAEMTALRAQGFSFAGAKLYSETFQLFFDRHKIYEEDALIRLACDK